MKFMHIDDRLSDYDRIRQLLKVEREVPAFEKVAKIVDWLKTCAIEEFGDAYREYAARTKRFIPGIV